MSAGRRYLAITVADDGPGIPEAIIDRVFEPFFTTKPKGRGNGLGLAISASIVAAHDGAIIVSSRVGAGTTFDVYLPLAESQVATVTPLVDAPVKVSGTERVLIIDDEIDLADAMSEMLSLMGYEVLPVYDPEEAVQLFRESSESWNIVLTDQIMPKLTGVGVIKRIKAIRPDIPIMLYSGFSDITVQQAIDAGASACLQKPIPAELVAAKIRELFATSAAREPGSQGMKSAAR
ncbi:MAG: response regulator [Alphaproteobacteria bacterium]|nr:response regulator [Alphaproteobacteria bacterium]